jgi:hypothetical protein
MMIAVAAFALYLASYRDLVATNIFEDSAGHPDQVAETYRCFPHLCCLVFAPANQLDRLVRPRYWAKPASIW